ncbi:helix-turn-helix domain-containing protein, partial [Bacteroides fragilis]
MEIKDRIKIIMEKENMASGAFAESIGIQQSTLSHILNGRNNPSLDVIMKVHQKYNYVKLEWLLYGQGNISEESIQSASDFQPSLFAENAII